MWLTARLGLLLRTCVLYLIASVRQVATFEVVKERQRKVSVTAYSKHQPGAQAAMGGSGCVWVGEEAWGQCIPAQRGKKQAATWLRHLVFASANTEILYTHTHPLSLSPPLIGRSGIQAVTKLLVSRGAMRRSLCQLVSANVGSLRNTQSCKLLWCERVATNNGSRGIGRCQHSYKCLTLRRSSGAHAITSTAPCAGPMRSAPPTQHAPGTV